MKRLFIILILLTALSFGQRLNQYPSITTKPDILRFVVLDEDTTKNLTWQKLFEFLNDSGMVEDSDLSAYVAENELDSEADLETLIGVDVYTENDGELGGGDFADGGEVGGADRSLGNTDNYGIGIKTNDAIKLWIAASGYIGVNNTAPTKQFEVTGDFKLTYAGSYIYWYNDTNKINYQFWQSGASAGITFNAYNGSGKIRFQLLGYDKLYMNNQGHFGFGHNFTTPSAIVHIKGAGDTSADSLFSIQNNSGEKIITITGDGDINVASNNLQLGDSTITSADVAKWDDELSLFLPDTLFVAGGLEGNIYFENALMVTNWRNYQYNITCDSGRTYSNRYAFTPNKSTNTNEALTLSIYGNSGILESDQCVVSVGDSIIDDITKILIIGDSNTDSNNWPAKLKDTAGDSLIFVGTQDTGTDSPNEGYSGKTYEWFCTNVSSPFINAGEIDIENYFTTNSLDDPDFIGILLGANDGVGYTLKSDVDILEIANYAKELVDSLLSYNATLKVGIALYMPPAYEQDAWGYNYKNNGCRWFHKQNIHRLNKKLVEYYGSDGTYNSYRVSVVPVYFNIDVFSNMVEVSENLNSRNSTTYTMQGNAIHPDNEGHWQIADAFYGWLANKW